jgi:hypothetical protein
MINLFKNGKQPGCLPFTQQKFKSGLVAVGYSQNDIVCVISGMNDAYNFLAKQQDGLSSKPPNTADSSPSISFWND